MVACAAWLRSSYCQKLVVVASTANPRNSLKRWVVSILHCLSCSTNIPQDHVPLCPHSAT